MKFSLWTQYGAMNSVPIFKAFENSLHSFGYKIVTNSFDADVAVIWSVLFHGRMSGNKTVWERFRKENKPVIVLEVGGIKRGTTWKVGLNGINRDAYFGQNSMNNIRSNKLKIKLKPWRTTGEFILVCGQHDRSLQWQNQPLMKDWFLQVYNDIRKHTDRPIIFRPHPRCRLPNIEQGLKHVYRKEPKHIKGTYDDFDLDFDNIWATVNWSSNPGIHSILNGVPAFVSTSSLAYDTANDIDFLHDIESPLMPDRQQWVNDYAWTEYTVDEISKGIPLNRLTEKLF